MPIGGVRDCIHGSWAAILSAGVTTLFLISSAQAGSGANFVTYNHHMADKGEAEISVYSDFSSVGLAEGYAAQLVELEYGVTDRWTSALYFEGVATEGESYAFGGWRFENRVRLFRETVPFNPVLYIEYEQPEPEHRYKHTVTGRTDGEEEDEESTEHEIESKLILGQDLSERLDIAFNWINEANLDNGDWEFGYAAGLNYTLFEVEGGRESFFGGFEEVKLGVELFGGLGDSVEGLTLDGGKTEQYAGINLLGELEGGLEIGAGVAFGLTRDSEDAIVRMRLSYEFK
ncbi:hypothetical protein [uncultured Hyphomicrobium sp.]|uniref:hypothetical protein n=1 Tax=uncultured Hyphomicrobium sp. TaxID=194373 RepID=UPI0025F11D95|nr:hypothetical protein [uncultured Hyphomicrobium sp.]